MSWNDARTACQNIQSAYDLVTIESANLNTFLKQHGNNWIGLSDVNTEGTYIWPNGETLKYGSTLKTDPWHSSNPNVIFLKFIAEYYLFANTIDTLANANIFIFFSRYIRIIEMRTVFILWMMDYGMITNAQHQ